MSQAGQNNDVIAIMVALYNFNAEEQPELTIRKGDELAVLDMDPALNGWAYAKRRSDGTEGYIPISYVASSANNNRSPNGNNNNKVFNQNRGNYGSNNYRNNNNNYQHNNNNNVAINAINNNKSSSPQQQQHQNENGTLQQPPNAGIHRQNGVQNEVLDDKQIICSFHRDFIPEMDDLYKYFGQFGKITNKLEIEYDNKKVPLAKIKYQNAQCVNKVVDRGNRQQIPSGAQNGTIHIRVYRSMKDYLVNTHGHSSHGHNQRQNNNNNNNNNHHHHRQPYNNRKGGNNRQNNGGGRGRGF